MRIENGHVGAGMVIRANRPMSHLALWCIRSVLSVEPFINMDIAPGGEFAWDVRLRVLHALLGHTSSHCHPESRSSGRRTPVFRLTPAGRVATLLTCNENGPSP